jgi:hypothetical protein
MDLDEKTYLLEDVLKLINVIERLPRESLILTEIKTLNFAILRFLRWVKHSLWIYGALRWRRLQHLGNEECHIDLLVDSPDNCFWRLYPTRTSLHHLRWFRAPRQASCTQDGPRQLTLSRLLLA